MPLDSMKIMEATRGEFKGGERNGGCDYFW